MVISYCYLLIYIFGCIRGKKKENDNKETTTTIIILIIITIAVPNLGWLKERTKRGYHNNRAIFLYYNMFLMKYWKDYYYYYLFLTGWHYDESEFFFYSLPILFLQNLPHPQNNFYFFLFFGLFFLLFFSYKYRWRISGDDIIYQSLVIVRYVFD